jgi:hypothetical protein
VHSWEPSGSVSTPGSQHSAGESAGRKSVPEGAQQRVSVIVIVGVEQRGRVSQQGVPGKTAHSTELPVGTHGVRMAEAVRAAPQIEAAVGVGLA